MSESEDSQNRSIYRDIDDYVDTEPEMLSSRTKSDESLSSEASTSMVNVEEFLGRRLPGGGRGETSLKGVTSLTSEPQAYIPETDAAVAVEEGGEEGEEESSVQASEEVINLKRKKGTEKESPQIFASIFSLQELLKVKRQFQMPDEIVLSPPGLGQHCMTDLSPNVCLYEKPFLLGLRLPLPLFVQRFLAYFDLAPGQLMPNCWRIILAMEVTRRKLGIEDLDPRVLLRWYHMKESTFEKHRYQLNSLKKAKLFTGTTSNDKKWKNRYFFVSGEWGRQSSDRSITVRASWNLNFGWFFLEIPPR